MPDLWGFAAIFTKFVLYLGILTAGGTVMVALVFRLTWYKGMAFGFACLGLIATILSFSLSGANLTGDASGMIDPEMLGLLWSTSVGTALMFRLVGLVLLIGGLAVGRAGLWMSVLGGIFAIWSFVEVGHFSTRGATMLDLILLLHLIAIAFWIGILTPLRRLAMNTDHWAKAATLGHKFGRTAAVAVPALVLAGGYMAYQLVGSLVALTNTKYGQALVLKILLVALLLGLAAANKMRFIPRMRDGDPSAARQLTKSVTLEWGIILAILGTTAILTSNLTLPT
jgi:putative copper resistance protein D